MLSATTLSYVPNGDGLKGSKTGWYKNMKIYRQDEDKDWGSIKAN